jgi:hypothetical protein
MEHDFQYDVFLSHSSKDKAVVCPLAKRLRQHRRRAFSQPSTVNHQPSGGSDWAQLLMNSQPSIN